ncbi:MAG: transporter associated domain-containing protein [Legionellaceae bacterium]|nr:transporter associated domain-containing protein [Legionellaceae bacterium]
MTNDSDKEKDKDKNNNPNSWLSRVKYLLQNEPQDQNDLLHLLRDAQNRSLIDAESLSMIEGVILFSQMRVRDIMLPKKKMVYILEHTELPDVTQQVAQSGHSRFPVLGENSEEVIGILHAKDLLRFQGPQAQPFELSDIIRQASIIPESKRLDALLSDFRLNRNHMAIVVDEYGVVSGFVTFEDVIEQIIGDISDEFDIDEEAHIKAHGDAHYMLKADTPIEDFNKTLQTHFSDQAYDTIGGIVIHQFGHVPQRGEHITIQDFEFVVVNADARNIKLLECIDKRTHDKLKEV